MKKLVLTAAATAALAATALLGTATARSGPPTGTLALVQLERDARSGFVDNPPRRRESAGDVFTIRGPVRDAANQPAGSAQATFTQTGRTTAHGSATCALAQGRIATAGTIGGGAEETLVITGGTGAYAGATGAVQVTERRDRVEFVFSFGS